MRRIGLRGSWRVAWGLLRGALPALTVATFIPLALFYAAMALDGEGAAVAVSVVYAYAACAYQYRCSRRVSGMLMVTVAMATVKAVTVAVSGQPTVYFAIPAFETAGFGLAFLVTMRRAEPLVVRLARDLFPRAADGLASRRLLVRRLSLLWTAAYVASGVTTSVLLLTVPLPVFVGLHTLTGWLWSGSAAASSLLMYRRATGDLASVLAPGAQPVMAW